MILRVGLLAGKTSWRIFFVAFLLAILLHIPSGYSARPVVNGVWTTTPPTVDGKFSTGEWTAPQLVFEVPPYPASFLKTYVYFVNDNQKLYVMVDAVGDRTDDQRDEVLLEFSFTSNMIVAFRGLGGFECVSNATNCLMPDGAHGMVGFNPSPNSALQHKIYEVSIPLKYLAAPGQPVDFASPKAHVFHCSGKGCGSASLGYDYRTERDNVWPQDLVVSKIETWGILTLASSP
jgi:hypothetical protein